MTDISATITTTGTYEYNTAGLAYNTIYVELSNTATYHVEVGNGGAWFAHPEGSNPASASGSRQSAYCFDKMRVRVTALNGTIGVYFSGAHV
jgi:hypothetical protein